MSTPPVGGILTTVDKPLTECLDQLDQISKILIIPALFSSQEGMEAMVKIIIPLSIQAISPSSGRIDYSHIIQITFSNHNDMTTQLLCFSVNHFPYIIQDVFGTEIEDSMNGVNS